MIRSDPAPWPTAASPEADWVAAAQSGDRQAFAQLHQRYRRMVHGILLSYVPHADAEDLLQEIFLHAMQKIASLREPAAFGAWLATISRNFSVNHHRRQRKTEEVTELNAGQTHAMEAAHLQAESAVLDAIRRLPAAYCETLMLRLVEGMTGPEIAEQTGLAPASVRVNLCRGMKLLREELGDTYFRKENDHV
jgi:RNA polymerase sigma-70 factor (ECF subfamily)